MTLDADNLLHSIASTRAGSGASCCVTHSYGNLYRICFSLIAAYQGRCDADKMQRGAAQRGKGMVFSGDKNDSNIRDG